MDGLYSDTGWKTLRCNCEQLLHAAHLHPPLHVHARSHRTCLRSPTGTSQGSICRVGAPCGVIAIAGDAGQLDVLRSVASAERVHKRHSLVAASSVDRYILKPAARQPYRRRCAFTVAWAPVLHRQRACKGTTAHATQSSPHGTCMLTGRC